MRHFIHVVFCEEKKKKRSMDTKRSGLAISPVSSLSVLYSVFASTNFVVSDLVPLACSLHSSANPVPHQKGFSSCLLPCDELHPELGLPPHHVHVAVTLPVDTLAHELEVVLEVELGKDEGHFEFGETDEKEH